MRFAEFKILLEEAGTYYTIGDSHAVAVATAGGKGWINLAIGGRSSTDTAMLANIAKIPKGATVLVSQGANDTANAMRASMESKKPPKDPKVIASNVANVVSKVESQGAKVIFMLFPNGPGRGPGLAQYYGGDYQEAVRNAIKSAINVPIIDINGAPLTDGVHAGMSTYRDVANQVKTKQPSTAPTAPKPEQGGMPSTGSTGFSIEVPDVSLGWKGASIMDVQKALVALGYDIGPPGVDGIRGKYTIAAIRKYQTDKGLKVDGDPGPETVGALNKDIKSNPNKFAKVEKSKSTDVKQSARVGQTYAAQPVAYDAVTKGKVGEVLNFVAGPESRGYYDMMFGSVRKPEILKMTIADANQFQNAWAKRAGSSAMGRYQIMHFNTIDYARKAGLDPKKDLFDPENQDKMGIIFLQEKGLDQWLNGKMRDKDFLQGLSQVWAGLPSPSKGGNSYYGGVGLNRHQTQVSMNSALDTLQDIKSA